jgi:hypothetical protein
MLKKMVSHQEYGGTVASVLSRILPPFLVKHFTLINEFLQFFDQVKRQRQRERKKKRKKEKEKGRERN